MIATGRARARVRADGQDGRAEAAEALVAEGRRVIRMEAAAVAGLADRLGSEFVRAAELIASSRGVTAVAGIGKSGLIARKVAATLTSTGTPAVFVHPVDGVHGDVGVVAPDSAVVVISRSGASIEVEGLVRFALRRRLPLIAMTGDVGSPLARRADAVLDCGVQEEACPLDLAPTSSSTAALAMGDALAAALLRRRGFGPNDFARLHPGGVLGRGRTLAVEDLMVREDYPAVDGQATVRHVIVPLGRMRGTVPVTSREGVLEGVVTTGDVARLMARAEGFLDLPVADFMTRAPVVAHPREPAAAALDRMRDAGVTALPVVTSAGARVVGMVHLHDILQEGVR